MQGFPWRGKFRPDMAVHEDGLTCLPRRPHRISGLKGRVGFEPGCLSRSPVVQDGSQPIDRSFAGGATRGWPIRSQIAPWPVAWSVSLIQL